MIYDKACGGGVITINSIGVAAMRPGPGALWRAQMRIIVALGGTALARRGEALDAEVQRRNIAHAIGAVAGIELPLHKAGIALFDAICARDFRAENDLLPALGLAELSPAELHRQLREG